MEAKRNGTMRAGIRRLRAIFATCSIHRATFWLPIGIACLCALALAQTGPGLPPLNESGQIVFAGRSTPYVIRHLPINSFPQLPVAVQDELYRRGCLIPQTYEAHRPENVVHGSFESSNSSDWAVLCSVHGIASLLVFFGSNPSQPFTLASEPETERLQPHPMSADLGFNWGIDTATPRQVREYQTGMDPRPPLLNHDAVADSVVEHSTNYHYFANGSWTLVPTAY